MTFLATSVPDADAEPGCSTVVRNNVTTAGLAEGPVMVLAHGFGCDQDMWSRLVPHFADTHRLVLFDHVGAGASDPGAYDAAKYATLEGYAADLLEVCHEMGLTDVTLVAHSVASMMAVVAAAAEPDLFSGLVLIAPSPRYVDDPEAGYVGGFSRADIDELLDSLDSNYYAWAAAMAPMVMGNPDRPELGDELTGRFCATDPTIARDFARVTFLSDTRDVLPRVSTRTLVLQCSDDLLAPPQVGAYVRDSLQDAVLVPLAATGHCPHVSAPDETAAVVHAYLGTGH
jgi:sigma-B regulation protein RsbQ